MWQMEAKGQGVGKAFGQLSNPKLRQVVVYSKLVALIFAHNTPALRCLVKLDLSHGAKGLSKFVI